MKKIIYMLAFIPSLAISADLSYLMDIKACANGETIKPILDERHRLLNYSIDSINNNFSTLILEKSQETWAKEIFNKTHEINNLACQNNKSCIPLKNLKEVRVFNTYRVQTSLKINLTANGKDFFANLKKNNFEIIEIPEKKINNQVIPKQLFATKLIKKDFEDKINAINSFKSVKDYFEYYQAYYGIANININLINTVNDIIMLNYSCSFNFAASENPNIIANKYKLNYIDTSNIKIPEKALNENNKNNIKPPAVNLETPKLDPVKLLPSKK